MREVVDKVGLSAWEKYQAAARIYFLCEIGQDIIWEKTQIYVLDAEVPDHWDIVTVFRGKGYHTRLRAQPVNTKTLLERIREI